VSGREEAAVGDKAGLSDPRQTTRKLRPTEKTTIYEQKQTWLWKKTFGLYDPGCTSPARLHQTGGDSWRVRGRVG